MPTYRWSCFACGTSNAPSSRTCGTCKCPVQATSKQMEIHREALIESGGQPLAGAAELDRLNVQPWFAAIGWVICVLLGVPPPWRK